MVTCNELRCKRRKYLDANGYCSQHSTAETVHSCKCGGCDKAVGNEPETKGLLCDSENCKVWYHLECTKISEQLYELMNASSKDSDDGIRWLCPKCVSTDPVITLSALELATSNVCKKLKNGTCPHGITGKTEYRGKVCEFTHPKLCKKFVKNGRGGRFGCHKADTECEFFHPILCIKSLKARKCLDLKCTYTHLKGTARKERKTALFPPRKALQAFSNRSRNANQQQNDWFDNGKHAFVDSTQNQGTLAYDPVQSSFLGPQKIPQPQLTSLQAQINRLEEIVLRALNAQHQIPVNQNQSLTKANQRHLHFETMPQQNWSY